MVAFATWSIACIVAIATLPTWSRPWVRDALLEKLSARLEQPVELGELELDYERVVLHDLVVGDPETPIIRLDEVVVDLEGHVLWRGRIDVERVHVTGGRVQGDRATLEGLARKAGATPVLSLATEMEISNTHVSAEGTRPMPTPMHTAPVTVIMIIVATSISVTVKPACEVNFVTAPSLS